MTTATVLLVEDEDAIREVTAFHLRHAGFDVVEESTAAKGWARLAEADLLVLDWMLPDESGLAFLRRLRAGPGAALPVLMLTARARQADRVVGLETGADDCLVGCDSNQSGGGVPDEGYEDSDDRCDGDDSSIFGKSHG